MASEQYTNQDSGYQSEVRSTEQNGLDGSLLNTSAEALITAVDHTTELSQIDKAEVLDATELNKISEISPKQGNENHQDIRESHLSEGSTASSVVEHAEPSSDHHDDSVPPESRECEAPNGPSIDTVTHLRRTPHESDLGGANEALTDNSKTDYHPGTEKNSAHTYTELHEDLIKSEPHDNNNILEATHVDQNVGAAPVSTLHCLPELGTTTVPDDDYNDDDGDTFDMSMDITSDTMAEMMKNMGQQADRRAILPEDVDSDEEDLRARTEFARIKEQFEAQARSKKGATMEEQLQFSSMAKQEDKRLRARRNRKQYEDDEAQRNFAEDSLFIPDGQQSPTSQEDELDDIVEQWCEPTSSANPSESNGQIEVPKEKSKRGRPKGVKTKNTTPKNTTKSGVSKKQPSKGNGSKRGRRSNQPLINPNSLLYNNMIAVAAANQNAAPQPVFTSKKKQDALKQLIDSIPMEERDQFVGDKIDLDKATRNFNGHGVMKADGRGCWILKGMKSSLHHYQLLGVSWMRNRENQNKHPKGGILSDDMGFGKTVSALANIVDGRPDSKHKGPRATLIIVPPALTNQWMAEVEKHVAIFNKVMVYSAKMKILDVVSVLGQHDIIITSYHEIVRSLPKENPPPHLYTAQAKAEWWHKEVEEHKGPLHRVCWHRIVLDEAQAIKNHLSKTSKAVYLLKGRFRWCLSGTPIQNSLEEFYPYFRFLRCPNSGSFDLFKRNFTKSGSAKAVQRLQVYLSRIMLRRTHSDQLFGRPILQLPPIKPVETIVVKFNPVERAIYNIVKQRFVMKIKSMTKDGSGQSSYAQIFVLLLRLRQLVGHPILIQKTLKDLLESEDFERLWSITKDKEITQSEDKDAQAEYESTVETLRAALLASPNAGANIDGLSSARKDTSDTQLTRRFRAYLDSLRKDGHWAQANARSICTACGGPPANPYVTSCLHIYCFTCLSDLRFSELMQNKDDATCMECAASIKTSEAYAATSFGDAGGMGRGIDGSQEPEEDIDWFSLPGPILRSAKIKGAVKKMKEWFEQDPSNKIIVFTQFRGLIKVMERVCREEDCWSFASYHGTMTFDQRDEQVRRFTEDPDCRILLAAMKAGGVGLNLVAANRVIILDLWWNISVESQAFTRCFRIGQTRDVEVARFVVQGSIDIDIQRMQERKLAEIEPAMEQKHHPTLNLSEIIELFDDGSGQLGKECETSENQTQNGEDDHFIIPDDPYDDGNESDDVIMTGTN